MSKVSPPLLSEGESALPSTNTSSTIELKFCNSARCSLTRVWVYTNEAKHTRLVLQIVWVFDLTLVNTKVKIIRKCYENILYHSPVWVHTGNAKEHNWKKKWRENMQSSICRKLVNLLTFHRKASKTQIYWFISVKISAKCLSLRSNNDLQEVESLAKKKQTKCQFNSSMSLLSCSVHHDSKYDTNEWPEELPENSVVAYTITFWVQIY